MLCFARLLPSLIVIEVIGVETDKARLLFSSCWFTRNSNKILIVSTTIRPFCLAFTKYKKATKGCCLASCFPLPRLRQSPSSPLWCWCLAAMRRRQWRFERVLYCPRILILEGTYSPRHVRWKTITTTGTRKSSIHMYCLRYCRLMFEEAAFGVPYLPTFKQVRIRIRVDILGGSHGQSYTFLILLHFLFIHSFFQSMDVRLQHPFRWLFHGT